MDRDRIKQVFKEYTDNYDATDGKIALKIDHTYRVAELSDRICESIGLKEEDKDVAWLIGMLHDIGRFEQVRRYGTFSDAESVNHADLSADLLFKENLISRFVDFAEGDLTGDREVPRIVEAAIRAHNKYRIPEEYDERTRLFSRIIRDSDKIDILKVNVEIPQEVIYDITTAELKAGGITPEVMQAFSEEHCILRSLKKTPIDNLIGHLSLIFELEFPMSYKIVKEQGYYLKAFKIMEESENPQTRELTKVVRERLERYIINHQN